MTDPVLVDRDCPCCGTRLAVLRTSFAGGFWLDDREGRVLWECTFCEASLPDVESEAA